MIHFFNFILRMNIIAFINAKLLHKICTGIYFILLNENKIIYISIYDIIDFCFKFNVEK